MTLLALLLACAPKAPEAVAAAPSVDPTPAAPVSAAPVTAPPLTAPLESRSGSTVTGSVVLEDAGGGTVRVTIRLAGATPGDHAVHVHANGDCSAPDAASAGPHFNPSNHAHGDHTSAEKHPGDFGNVTVGADGTGSKTLELTSLTLREGPVAAAGHAVIVHEKPDDFSQPTGNAGGRQACGVLR
jgi:Cu-Zn family superoxide dismutase